MFLVTFNSITVFFRSKIKINYLRTNIYDHLEDVLGKDYKPEYITREFVAQCNDVIDIHPYNDATKNPPAEVKPDDGEIQPEDLPEPQKQSSSFSSYSNVDSIGTRSIQEDLNAQNRSRRSLTLWSRPKRQLDPNAPSQNPYVYTVPNDGVYLLVVYVGATSNTLPYTASVHVEVCVIRSSLRYLYYMLCSISITLSNVEI